MDLTKTNNANIIYRLPNSKNAYICCGSILSKIHDYINDYETEFFVISAFNQNNNPFVFSIASKQIFEYGNHDMFHQYYSNKIYPNLNKNHYIKLITKAVHELKINNSLKKIVLSRPHIKENNNFNPILLFNQLCETFPTAFIYLVSCNDTGTWIGASPEILLTSNPNEIQTVALAGTIDNNEKSMWSSKEYEEQHLVEIYIEEILLKHARTFNKTGPEELKSGSIKHLFSKYKIQNKDIEISCLIDSLNPTPAVAGLPKKEAINYILKEEGYSRNFYTGYVGIKEKNELNLFVNLRCMEIQKNQLIQFAGAGILKDSDPEKEYIETEKKLQAIAQFL